MWVGGGAGLFSAPSPSMTSSTSCLAWDLAKSSYSLIYMHTKMSRCFWTHFKEIPYVYFTSNCYSWGAFITNWWRSGSYTLKDPSSSIHRHKNLRAISKKHHSQKLKLNSSGELLLNNHDLFRAISYVSRPQCARCWCMWFLLLWMHTYIFLSQSIWLPTNNLTTQYRLPEVDWDHSDSLEWFSEGDLEGHLLSFFLEGTAVLVCGEPPLPRHLDR